jgi:hypothetical protein
VWAWGGLIVAGHGLPELRDSMRVLREDCRTLPVLAMGRHGLRFLA